MGVQSVDVGVQSDLLLTVGVQSDLHLVAISDRIAFLAFARDLLSDLFDLR